MNLLEKYKGYFQVVCDQLGEGWRLDLRKSHSYAINIFNPNLKNYIVIVRMRDNRFSISDSITRPLTNYNSNNKCTAAVTRKPESVARDIKNKIIFNAEARLVKAKDILSKEARKKETELIVKGVMNQLVSVNRHYSKICSFHHRHDHKISGTVDGFAERDSYRLELSNLSQEQLIKIVAAVSSL